MERDEMLLFWKDTIISHQKKNCFLKPCRSVILTVVFAECLLCVLILNFKVRVFHMIRMAGKVSSVSGRLNDSV